MYSNKVTLFWYKIAARTRNALETGCVNIQNKFYLNREWSVAAAMGLIPKSIFILIKFNFVICVICVPKCN